MHITNLLKAVPVRSQDSEVDGLLLKNVPLQQRVVLRKKIEGLTILDCINCFEKWP